jgi:hypothetical protein
VLLFVSSDYLDLAYYSYAYKYNNTLGYFTCLVGENAYGQVVAIGSNFNQLAMGSGSFIKKIS